MSNIKEVHDKPRLYVSVNLVLENGRHVGQLRRRRRRAHAPTSNTASHDNHENINSWVSFSFLDEYGAPLDGPSGRRSSAPDSLAFLIEARDEWISSSGIRCMLGWQ